MKRSCLILVCLVSAASQAALFDFESLTPSYTGVGGRPGAYTSVSQTSDGITVNVTRSGGLGFDVYGYNNDPMFGSRWLDGFNITNEDRPFILDFSVALSEFSLWHGQFTASTSRTATLRAYSGAGGTGTLLAESTGTIPITLPMNTSWTGVNLTVAGSAIRSVTASITGSFNNGFIDQGVATAAVPEPASALILFAGASLLARRRPRA